MLTYNYPEIADYFGRKVKLDWAEDSEHDGVDLPNYEPAIREGDAKLLLAYNDTTDSSLKHVVKATATASQLVMGDGSGASATASQLVMGDGSGASATASQLVMGDGSGASATASQLVMGDGSGLDVFLKRLNKEAISFGFRENTGHFDTNFIPQSDFNAALFSIQTSFPSCLVLHFQKRSAYTYVSDTYTHYQLEGPTTPGTASQFAIACLKFSLQLIFEPEDGSCTVTANMNFYSGPTMPDSEAGFNANMTSSSTASGWNFFNKSHLYLIPG